MGILDGGIAIADGVLKALNLEATITHRAWTGQDRFGAPSYATAVPYKAVVDLTRKQRLTSTGVMINVVATVTILEVVPSNGATGRKEPVDPRDIITLPDGTTGPVFMGPGSVVNPATNKPFLNELLIGEV